MWFIIYKENNFFASRSKAIAVEDWSQTAIGFILPFLGQLCFGHSWTQKLSFGP